MPTDTPVDSHAPAPDGAALHGRVDDAGRILGALRSIVRELRLASHEAVQRVGVHSAQCHVLRQLADSPGLSMTELAGRTHTDISAVSVVVSRLVEQGLVVRRPAEDDRRRLSLRLTGRGRAAARRAPDTDVARLTRAASRVSGRELHTLAGDLSKLADGFDQHAD
ncbi:MAG TPA: MarR family transcriptional regulator [Gemmatimonadaceae bacterium]|nr:MarR family transcriptional regulator [Gemmatimonadaceae bacterium]